MAAAEAALAENDYVTPIDVLVGIGWLHSSHVDRWRQGRIDYFEQAAQVDPPKLRKAMSFFRQWADDRELDPSESLYVARTRHRRPLLFSPGGGEGLRAPPTMASGTARVRPVEVWAVSVAERRWEPWVAPDPGSPPPRQE